MVEPSMVPESAVPAAQPVLTGEPVPPAAAAAVAAAEDAEEGVQLPLDDGSMDLDSRLKVGWSKVFR